MKKRILTLLLVMALLLCGCGNQEKPSSNPTTTFIPVATEAVTEAPTEAVTEAATEPAPTEPPVSLGILEGGTYTNAYVGFGFTLDENWTVYPADQLQELPENISSIFEGTELESYDGLSIIDVLGENVADLTTINVLYQKLTMQERLAYLTMTEEQILNMMLTDYYDALVASYENAGIHVENMSTKKVTFLGQERTALHTVTTTQGVPYYILQLYDFQLGQYSITTTVASYVDDNTEGLLELFYAVD